MSVESCSASYHRILTEFIDMYRLEPCLWMTKSPEYLMKPLKNAAYERLTAKLKELDESADRVAVRSKIDNLRNNWQKEKAKIVNSTAEPSYKPRLWYFDLLNFLDDNNNKKKYECEKLEDCDEYLEPLSLEELQNEEPSQFIENYNLPDFNFVTKKQCSRIEITNEQLFEENVIKSHLLHTGKLVTFADISGNEQCSYDSLAEQVPKQIKIQEDRYEVFGRLVAMKLANITDTTQQMLVEKLINDILFLAELGQLKMAHAVTLFNT